METAEKKSLIVFLFYALSFIYLQGTLGDLAGPCVPLPPGAYSHVKMESFLCVCGIKFLLDIFGEWHSSQIIL